MRPAFASVPIGAAVRRVWSKGYTLAHLRADLLAGSVVGVVALPLSMALAIAIGAPPERGLYTAIFAGGIVALLGGCKFQVTGPTAAFVVVLAPIVTKHGLGGLLTAGLLAGVFLVAMGLARMGNLIQYIPYPVTTGFTTGIAVVIATLQVKDVLGLSMAPMPEHYVEKLTALWSARGSFRFAELLVAAATLGMLLVVPRVVKRIPAPLIALTVAALGVVLAKRLMPGLELSTIGSRFHYLQGGVERAGIPSSLPHLMLPWTGTELSFALIRELTPAAFAIAMLGAIESLLSAVVADGMTGTRHEPNSELVALGIGNIIAPLFGGIAATGALARTATNIRSGARSPVSAIFHSIFVLAAMLLIAPLVAYVPMASLAALLLLVAWNMSEIRHFFGVLSVAPKSDRTVLLVCFLLTVFFDMVTAVSVGFVLAAVLFMRRMAELTQSTFRLDASADEGAVDAAHGVAVYEINGPLFFGAARRAIDALTASNTDSFRVLVLNLGKVPAIDATGFVALEAAIETLSRNAKSVVIAGPLPKPSDIFERADLARKYKGVYFADDLGAALDRAHELVS